MGTFLHRGPVGGSLVGIFERKEKSEGIKISWYQIIEDKGPVYKA